MQIDFSQGEILNKIRHKRLNSFHSSLPKKSTPLSKFQNQQISKIKTENDEQNQEPSENYKLKKCWQKLEEAESLNRKIRFIYRQQQNLIQQQKKQTNFVNFCKKTFQKQRTTLQRLKTKYGKIVQIRRNHHLQQRQLKKQKSKYDQQIYKEKLKLKESVQNQKQDLQTSRSRLRQQKVQIANRIRYSLEISRKKCFQKEEQQFNRRKRIYCSIKQQEHKVRDSMAEVLNQKKRTINRMKLNKLVVQLQTLNKHKSTVQKLRQKSQQYQKRIKEIKNESCRQIQSYKKKLYLQSPCKSTKQQKTLATTITLFKKQQKNQMSFT